MGANLEIFNSNEDDTEIKQEDLIGAIDVLLGAIEEAENSKEELITERSELKKELSELKSTIVQLNKELDIIDQGLQNYRVSRESLEHLTKAFYYDKLIADNPKFYQDHPEDLKYFSRKISAEMGELNFGKADNNNLKIPLGKLMEKLNLNQGFLKKIISTAETIFNKLSSDINELTGQISALVQKYHSDSIKYKIEEIKKNTLNIDSNAITTSDSEDESKLSSENLTDTIKQLATVLEEKDEENSVLEKNNAQAADAIEKMKHTIAEFQIYQKNLQDKHIKLIESLSMQQADRKTEYAVFFERRGLEKAQLSNLIYNEHQEEFIKLVEQCASFRECVFDLSNTLNDQGKKLDKLRAFLYEIKDLQNKLHQIEKQPFLSEENFLNDLVAEIESAIEACAQQLMDLKKQLEPYELPRGLDKILAEDKAEKMASLMRFHKKKIISEALPEEEQTLKSGSQTKLEC